MVQVALKLDIDASEGKAKVLEQALFAPEKGGFGLQVGGLHRRPVRQVGKGKFQFAVGDVDRLEFRYVEQQGGRADD